MMGEEKGIKRVKGGKRDKGKKRETEGRKENERAYCFPFRFLVVNCIAFLAFNRFAKDYVSP
jgi:hypothetical protein